MLGFLVKLRRVVLAWPILVLAVFPTPPAAAAGEAEDVVSSFQGSLVDVMKQAKTLGVKGRYEKLQPVIDTAFDIPLMAQICAGGYWQTGTDAQRRDLVAAFRRYSISTLATLFDGYSGEKFEVAGKRQGPQGTTMVDTLLHRQGEPDIKITYVARPAEGRWRLIDVIVDVGISELKRRISEFQQVLRTGGLNGLIKLLNDKADQLVK